MVRRRSGLSFPRLDWGPACSSSWCRSQGLSLSEHAAESFDRARHATDKFRCMSRPGRRVDLKNLRQAFDEARFGARRTLNLRESLPSADAAAKRAETWLRQQQVESAEEVLIITGRGNQSEGG